MRSIKDRLKTILPKKVSMLFSVIRHPFRYYKRFEQRKARKHLYEEKRLKHRDALSLIKSKKPLRCVFLALFESVWKFDKVYQLMEESDRFEPIILVCPIVNYGRENQMDNMARCMSFFRSKNYRVVCAYDEQSDHYIDIIDDLQPDILVYTNPYKGLIDDRYFIDKFDDILTVYVPYYFNICGDLAFSYDLALPNLVWRWYLETETHKEYAEKTSLIKGKNVVVSGYPGIEYLLDKNYPPEDNWIDKSHLKKRIIWAPHHTISPVGIIFCSCFLRYCIFMLTMAKKYESFIEMIFKPHPILKNKLYEFWGKEKTDYYYSQWEIGTNTQLYEGDYIDLFLTSDAMIHDSGSFTVEYLYVNKPVMRTMNEEDINVQFNRFGIECINKHYKAYNEDEIESFIQNIIQGIDPMKEQRSKFVRDVLMPKESPSLAIFQDIVESIDEQRL